jgi:SAM-dependent methyltransferase
MSAFAASFRDPSGRLLSVDGRVIRVINSAGIADLDAFLASKTAQHFLKAGRLVGTRRLDESELNGLSKNEELRKLIVDAGKPLVLEHERIPFPSFPYEWSPEMLYAAAELTLDLAESLLGEGLGLKDATPYNVLFRGPEPVFVDLLSFEKRDPGDPIWLPNAQMERTFLLPLLVNRQFGLPLDQILTGKRDGLEPEDVYNLCGSLRRFSPRFLGLVTIPVLLASKHDQKDLSIYQPRRMSDPEKARFILESLLKRTRKRLQKVAPRLGRHSEWSDYMSANNNYSDEQLRHKVEFVETAVNEFKPRRVLDIGANTGHFSLIAARGGAEVVAIDSDPVVAGEIWRRSKAENANVLPLAVNLTRPSPALGWRNRECTSFLDRARGCFDTIFMLAVIHHMLVTERIPLDEIIDLASELTTDLAIIEFISPEDSMFRRISRGRDHLFVELTQAVFEESCRRRFEIIRSQQIEKATRRLYLLRKKVSDRC